MDKNLKTSVIEGSLMELYERCYTLNFLQQFFFGLDADIDSHGCVFKQFLFHQLVLLALALATSPSLAPRIFKNNKIPDEKYG